MTNKKIWQRRGEDIVTNKKILRLVEGKCHDARPPYSRKRKKIATSSRLLDVLSFATEQEDTMTEKRFTLHDGEDEQRTAELSEFMDGLDWCGDDSGVYFTLYVRVGDVMVRSGENLRVERKK